MLLFAFLYTRFALFDNPVSAAWHSAPLQCEAPASAGRHLDPPAPAQGFLASFYGIRPCVPAFALKATIKLRRAAPPHSPLPTSLPRPHLPA